MKYFAIPMFFVASFFLVASAQAATVDYTGGDLSLAASVHPYFFDKKIVLPEGVFLRIDKGVQIDFGQKGDLCFTNGECLKGDWLLKNGLKSCSVVFDSNIYLYASPGSTKMNFNVSRGSVQVVSKTKILPIFLRSLEANLAQLTLFVAEDKYTFNIFLEAMTASDVEKLKKNQTSVSSETPSCPNLGLSCPALSSSSISISVSPSYQKQEIDWQLATAKKGLIFIETQQNGEAWYVNPADSYRYYLGRPNDAFYIMRRLGLGVKHEVIQKGVFPDRLSGRILIDVEDKGRAYYINPKNKKAYYLGRPEDAFRIMVELGVGISEENIKKIGIGMI